MTKKRLLFDIETDGLYEKVATVWCMVTQDVDTNEVLCYSDYDDRLPNLDIGLAALHAADVLIGHNFINYDISVLGKLRGWSPLPHQRLLDTWIMSMVNRYRRDHLHGLGGWGQHLESPKGKYDDWTKYTRNMLKYCIQDVALNVKVYHAVAQEANKISRRYPLYAKGLEVEMKFAQIEAEISHTGWRFDMPAAEALMLRLETRMAIIEQTLEPIIGARCIAIDGKSEFKTPIWTKSGNYAINTVKHFGYPIEAGLDERPLEGPYSRVEFVQGKLGTITVVRDYLYSIGWVPDEWNTEKVGNKWINTTPKMSDTSLSILGEGGTMVSEYYTIRARKGILEGWIKAASVDGRLHGNMWTVGTPTFRCRHEVVANIPSVDAPYGPEMRSLLIAEEGCSLVGADSSGNQMRGLCHLLNNQGFTNEVINGDVHQRNADVLGVSRKLAKPFLYAFLFGGGKGKLGQILTGATNPKAGAKALEKFQDSIPGMKELKESLESQFEESSAAFGERNAFIRGLDGRIVFTSSPHMVLNYALQTIEGITCKAAAVYMKEKLVANKIHHQFVLHMHDEFCLVVKDEDAEQVSELAVEAFTEAPKWFGIECMGGSSHIGKSYDKVH